MYHSRGKKYGECWAYLYTHPVLIKTPSFQQQQLEQIPTLAVLHDKRLVGGIFKDAIQLRQSFPHQALHQLDLPLHAQEVFGLHLGFLIGFDDHCLFADGAQRFVNSGDAAVNEGQVRGIQGPAMTGLDLQ